ETNEPSKKPRLSPHAWVHSWVRPDVFRQLYGAQDAATSFAAQLNFTPTFWFLLPLALFFWFVSYLLQKHVVDGATGHLAVFALGAYIVFSSYFVCDYAMSRLSTSYASIPDDKKFYPTTEMCALAATAVLFAYCPLAVHFLYEAMALDHWSTARIHNMGVLYAIPDFVSLFMVSRMSTSTKLHHCCVVAFMIYNLNTDYSTERVARSLVVYAVFTTFAYLVNVLLASRFLQIGKSLRVLYRNDLVLPWPPPCLF
ncbi:MAG: hypothetical protein SGPRY_001077, partial [Prymnesium sp.]